MGKNQDPKKFFTIIPKKIWKKMVKSLAKVLKGGNVAGTLAIANQTLCILIVLILVISEYL